MGVRQHRLGFRARFEPGRFVFNSMFRSTTFEVVAYMLDLLQFDD